MNNFRGNISSDEVVEWLKKVQNISIEQSSEDLKKAAKEYVKENCILPEDCNDGDNPYYEECTAAVFKDGAHWQKEQMMKSAVDAIVDEDTENSHIKTLVFIGKQRDALSTRISNYEFGEMVKIIIFKEDEQ